jgi:hypothetical protein
MTSPKYYTVFYNTKQLTPPTFYHLKWTSYVRAKHVKVMIVIGTFINLQAL